MYTAVGLAAFRPSTSCWQALQTDAFGGQPQPITPLPNERQLLRWLLLQLQLLVLDFK
jgi:hypothetical protein